MRAVFIFVFTICVAAAWSTAAEEISGRAIVIDGDTLDVGVTRVRLFGIDAPEQNQ